MWLVTTNGFYSIVRKPWDREAGTLTVRARARSDLESLRAKYLPELGEIQESTSRDYRFRAQAPQARVAEAVRRVVADIDYDNFKDAVAERQGLARERVACDRRGLVRSTSLWTALNGNAEVRACSQTGVAPPTGVPAEPW